MDHSSPFLAMQQVERQLKGYVRGLDPDTLSVDEKKVVASLKLLSSDARIDIRDYELSETRAEQLKHAAAGKKRLAKLQVAVLAIGPMLGAADVAHLSAHIEQISSQLI